MGMKQLFVVFCLVLLLPLVAGCLKKPAEMEPIHPSEHSETPVGIETTESDPEPALPPESDPVQGENTDANEEDETKDHISVASPQAEKIEPELPEHLLEKPDEKKNAPGKQPVADMVDNDQPFNPDQPTLMGIAIGTEIWKVTNRYGEPVNTFPLPDDTVEAHVRVYPGFQIGVRNNKVLFVEVNSRSVNPGLNGLRLGDTYDKAIAALGTPDLDNDYVIGYTRNQAVLKLDLDPERKTIHSIKLFPEE